MNKKLTAAVLAGVMTLALCACGSKAEAKPAAESPAAEATEAPAVEATEAPVGMPNPLVEYTSLEEINDLTGANLCAPAVMGVTDEAYYVISTEPKIAQYDFSVNGTPYSFRYSPDFTADISGIYENGETIFNSAAIGETAFAESGDYKSACFFTTDGRYVLTVEDKGAMEMDTFKAIVDEMSFLVKRQDTAGDDLAAYEGSWHESIAGRGMIDVTSDGGELSFNVTWPNSAAEVYVTSFSGVVENGTLSYANGSCTSYVYDSEGKVTEENVRYTDGTGSVVFNDDNTFTWIEDGYNDEGSVFVKD